MRYIKKFFVLCAMLTACGTVALAQGNGCSGKVSQDLANQLLLQAFKSEETSPEDQDKLIRTAKKLKDGVATLFCAESVDLDRDGKQDLLIHQADIGEAAFC